MHKNPIDSMFISASSVCTTKFLSQLLNACLNLTVKHYKEYCAGIARNTGGNCFWIIDNSMQVLSKLKRLNKVGTATHFDSFDFTTHPTRPTTRQY